MRRATFFLLASLHLTACGGDSATSDGGVDAADARADGPLDLGAESCFTDADCDDGNACTVDRCMFATGTCRRAPRDADADGHGDAACGGDDCDDTDPARYPAAHETCNAIDEDCDPATLGPDTDADGDPSNACCNPQTDGSTMCGADCDDTSATIGPTAAESCNGVDDDCDGSIDESVHATCWPDVDGDGYAPTGSTAVTSACTCESGFTARDPAAAASGDCDDADATVSPAQAEVCNFRDDNCNCVPDAVLSSCIDEGLTRPTTSATSHFHVCVGAPFCLSLLASASPSPLPTGFEVLLDSTSAASDVGAAWQPAPMRLGWGAFDVTVQARAVADAAHPAGVGFSVAILRHRDGSSLAGVASDLGYPIDHDGLQVEWLFNGAGADELVAIKHEAPPTTSTPVAFEMARVSLGAPRLDTDTDRPARTFTVRYRAAAATGGEELEVYDGTPGTGTLLMHLDPTSPGITVSNEYDVYEPLDVGVTAAGDATTRSTVFFVADASGATVPFQSTVVREGVCDTGAIP